MRKLKGVAFQGKYATVIFRKWTSLSPKIVLLHEDFHSIETALNNVAIETRPLLEFKN